jgi:hypothetical protein
MDGDHFTEKVRERLSANRYVAKISPNQISFTDEFRIMMAREIEEAVAAGACDINNMIRQTLSRVGIDPGLIDSGRIASIRSSIRGMVAKTGRVEATGDGAADAKRLQRLEGQILYMQQEMEFIKKILSGADMT